MKTRALGIWIAALTSTLAAAGCSTESFCWNCGNEDSGSDTGAGGYAGSGYGGQAGGIAGSGGTFIVQDGGGGSSDACKKSQEKEMVCDGLDDDCNGKIDETFDLTKDARNCGVCSIINPDADCTLKVQNAEHALCTATAGTVGKCDYDKCSADYFDLDGNRANGCEYYCVKKGDTDTTCDNIDDDCNGKFDDGVDKCNNAANCGKCGRKLRAPERYGQVRCDGQPRHL